MKKVLLVAPVMSRSGYGEMGRFAMRSLLSNPNVDLYIHNINWGNTGWIWKDDDERRMIDSLLQKTVIYRQNGGQFDSSIQCTIPSEWKRLTPHDVGYTAGIETNMVAGEWLVLGNEMDKIITISDHSRDVYKNTTHEASNNQTGEVLKDYRCDTEIEAVGFPVKEISPESLDLNLRHDFNFLCVAQLGPRKNIDAVLNNFIEEFKNDDVGLILKLNGAKDSVMDYHSTKKMFSVIQKAAKRDGWKCSINLLHGNLTDEQMAGLYRHDKIKAMVSFTHGEGFGLPMYEASAAGLPIVATDWSGHLDFLTLKEGKKNKKLFAAVKYTLEKIPREAVWNGVLHHESKWAVVDDIDARKKMRDVYKNFSKWEKKANKLSASYKGSGYWYDRFNKATMIDSLNLEEESKVEVP